MGEMPRSQPISCFRSQESRGYLRSSLRDLYFIISVCVVIAVGVAGINVSAAWADHENGNPPPAETGHWPFPAGNIQYVDWDENTFFAGNNMGAYVGTAATTWKSWGGPWLVGANSPGGVLAYERFWVKIAVTSRATIQALGCTASNVVGCTRVTVGSGHILGTVSRTCNNCGQTWQAFQATVTHELGHAIGLGHNFHASCASTSSSVMCESGPGAAVTWEDWYALKLMYDPQFYYPPYHYH